MSKVYMVYGLESDGTNEVLHATGCEQLAIRFAENYLRDMDSDITKEGSVAWLHTPDAITINSYELDSDNTKEKCIYIMRHEHISNNEWGYVRD